MYYKIIYTNRNSDQYLLYNANTLDTITDINVNAFENKLFSNDVFEMNELTNSNKNIQSINIIHSSTRIAENIPGVLLVADNITYGRTKKQGKLLYKCIPDDLRIPEFLVPYEIKSAENSKKIPNLYVTVQYVEWTDKHPRGQLTQVIGSVDVLDNFYEYQLYCKSLNNSIQKLSKLTNHVIKGKSHDTFIMNMKDKYPELVDRTDLYTFTIDPEKGLDYDDAFSIKEIFTEASSSQTKKHTCLSIYIANVSIWLDILNLWTTFSKRISTIYLPDKKRPMLPTILSDCLCSLQQGCPRVAFVMDIIVDEHGVITDITWSNCIIKISKNYVYEHSTLLELPDYNLLVQTCKKMTKHYKYIKTIKDSHDVVAYLMVLMNHHCAQKLLVKNTGIFRSSIMQQKMSDTIFDITEYCNYDNIPEDVGKFIKIWNSSSSQYLDISKVNKAYAHELMDLDAYIHITSPIRRLVDLLNIIRFQEVYGLIKLTNGSNIFYEKWL